MRKGLQDRPAGVLASSAWCIAWPSPRQCDGISGDENKAGKLEQNIKANVEQSTIDQDIEVVKSDGPDRDEGGNECKTKQRQTIAPQASTHQPES